MYSQIRNISLVLVLVLGLAVEVANADFIWGTPTNLGPEVNSSYDDACVCISANGLEFYFTSNRPGGYGGFDIWVMQRATIEENWGDPMNLGSPANSQYSYWDPSISLDGLSLYFSDGHTPDFGNRSPGGLGGQGDIWKITRKTIHDAWGAPVNIGPAVNSQHAVHPSISADGLSLYFQSHRPGALGGCDIMVATRKSVSDPFGDPVFLKNVSSTVGEWMPEISTDGRALFFCRSVSMIDLWVFMATRATIYDDFGPPLKLPSQINISSRIHSSPHLSADGRTLFFDSTRPGGVGRADLYEVPIVPILDFNGDGIVDVKDIVIMTEHWGEDYPLCDIGPTPLGVGLVDIQDLVVLTEHIEPIDQTLIAHWTLDEAEGIVASDSVGNNDGYVMGDPVWQPTGGQVDGAIMLDGLDDSIVTGPIPNLAERPISVLAWIIGGAPGQVIISQSGGGVNWLLADPTEGNLMSELKAPSRSGDPILSQTNITDGNWHRIGFIWDGFSRILYVDDVAVAQDAQDSLVGSENGLYIGTGKAMESGTFFSGLIDDVRIYNRAVIP